VAGQRRDNLAASAAGFLRTLSGYQNADLTANTIPGEFSNPDITGAKTEREALVTAVECFNRLKRLGRLNARVRGQFHDASRTQSDA
jgi:hypothetical protein